MPITKRGIYHNLKESTYTVTNGEITLYFSSVMYMKKFLNNYESYRNEFADTMDKVASHNPLNMDTLADISLYRTIEKRGFRAMIRGLEISWQELHAYALRKMTEKNITVWQKAQKLKLPERLKIME